MIFSQTAPLKISRPLWQHGSLFPEGTCFFLLDSALKHERLGRRTYLGGQPAALLTGKRLKSPPEWPDRRGGDHVGGGQPFHLVLKTWKKPDGTVLRTPETSHWAGDPYIALARLQADYGQGPGGAPCPAPTAGVFQGGLVGCFGYEMAYASENLPDRGEDGDLPDLAFMVADAVLCQDLAEGETTLAVTGRGADQAEAQADAAELSRTWLRWLEQPLPRSQEVPDAGPVAVRSHFDLESYSRAVDRCREHILAGDVFEVCLTHRMEADLAMPAWDLYRRLRHLNPAPFAGFLQFPDFQVLSASPERFLKLDESGVAESRPIKGTRPRGETPADDARLRAELAASEKDRAENLMIVDLVRSDLGRVARIGSVEVPELLAVEDYATVFQLVSTIRARLRPECDALDLVRACYPGGSMTGAPKIEAMKIIDAMEPVKRGIYSGALGYLDRGGPMDLGMVIRTIVCQEGKATFGVGGAVTADSDPEAEYRETLDKARALIRALGGQAP